MVSESSKFEVIHNAEKNRVEASINGQLGLLEYTLRGNKIYFTHTEVPVSMQRQGLGSALARAALEYARGAELEVVAVCPFVQHYLEKHPGA